MYTLNNLWQRRVRQLVTWKMLLLCLYLKLESTAILPILDWFDQSQKREFTQ
tara:strand:- start:168 stop:323 length:156 start_codon:yes stop_codon:yes gene_type:complete